MPLILVCCCRWHCLGDLTGFVSPISGALFASVVGIVRTFHIGHVLACGAMFKHEQQIDHPPIAASETLHEAASVKKGFGSVQGFDTRPNHTQRGSCAANPQIDCQTFGTGDICHHLWASLLL